MKKPNNSRQSCTLNSGIEKYLIERLDFDLNDDHVVNHQLVADWRSKGVIIKSPMGVSSHGNASYGIASVPRVGGGSFGAHVQKLPGYFNPRR